MYQICESLHIEYNKVLELALKDNRLNKTHFLVPGPDGDFGFGGTCLPKDTKGLADLVDKLQLDLNIFKAIVEENEKFVMKVPEGMRKEI